MKIKYLRLSKEERNNAKQEYFKTKKGAYVKKQLRSAKICSILCMVYAVGLFIEAIIKSNNPELVASIIIITMGLVFIILSRSILIKSVNNYITKERK